MQRLLVLGGGTAGTMVVNKLRRKLDRDRWQITVVDQDDNHLYQPGFLFIPFGVYAPAEVQRSRHRYIPDGVELVLGEIDRVDADANKVLLTDGRELGYNYLVIATGTTPRPDQTPGMLGSQWRKSIFDFYSLDGATALTGALAEFDGGRVVVHVTDMPIKCPVAPLEFTFLAEAYFRSRDMRDRVELTYVTPLPGAFTKPIASQHLSSMLTERKVEVEPDFMVERIDDENKTLISYDEREIPFDLLVTVPLNMGADYITRSGLGDELNYVPVDKHTLLSKARQHLRDRRRLRHPGIQGRISRALLDRAVRGQLRQPRQWAADDTAVRRARQLLHRVRARQGPAHRLQLHDRAAAGEVPAARSRPVQPAAGVRGQPLGEADVPVG